MLLRICAAICGGAILIACLSPALAESARENVTQTFHGAAVIRAKFSTWACMPSHKASACAARRGPADDGMIFGAASMYNPFKPGYREGGVETASGERYDPGTWTAAIKSDLRHMFGGVHFGSDYKPAYALVESGKKRAIIRISDVGPLKPGRVIDFNERTMRYFDPLLRRGLIARVILTPLSGESWIAGPLGRNG